MAGDWIVWTKGLTRKREIMAIARQLQIDRRVAACLCMEVWEWADAETADGNVHGVTKDDIDRFTGVTGLAQAMTDTGWLIEEAGGLRFPNWDRYNTRTAKNRLQTRERVRNHRQVKRY